MPLPMHRAKRVPFLTAVATIALLVAGSAQAAVYTNTNMVSGQQAKAPSGQVPVDSSGLKIVPADPENGVSPPPPILSDLQSMVGSEDAETKPDTVGLQIRGDALREAALSYGARGGLAHRTFEIQRRLAENDGALNKTYDFTRLLIAAPSGLLIEPPIVSEAQRAVIVNSGGQAAAVADRVYRINRVARIVTSARDWHLYLERDWGRVDPPPGILLPKTADEQTVWAAYVKQGWDAGVKQADETFESDLDRLTNDLIGMVRYRELLAQGMISPPFALADDRGVTGGGSEMRIGDRGVTITGQSVLIPKSNTWTPANR